MRYEGTCHRCTNTLVHLLAAVNPYPQEETRNEQDDVASARGRHRGAWPGAGWFGGAGTAEGGNRDLAAARHFLHAEPHHREAEADREACRRPRRARRYGQVADL